MKPWVGRWLIGVSVVHTVFAITIFGEVLVSIAKRGVFNTVGTDPMIGAVVWFVLFGAMLFVCGLTMAALEKASPNQLPRSIGWSLFALSVIGVTLMPVSGFWLVFPPAIAVLVKKASPPRAAIEA
jgi:uncharacterized membrane protein YccF (DUF307 family)